MPVERLLIADLPVPGPVGHVEVRRITMPPSTASGPHRHNGPVFGTLLSGSVVFRVEGGGSAVLRPGDPFFEPADTMIEAFDATEEGAVFLAWFPLPAGEAGRLTSAG